MPALNSVGAILALLVLVVAVVALVLLVLGQGAVVAPWLLLVLIAALAVAKLV